MEEYTIDLATALLVDYIQTRTPGSAWLRVLEYAQDAEQFEHMVTVAFMVTPVGERTLVEQLAIHALGGIDWVFAFNELKGR